MSKNASLYQVSAKSTITGMLFTKQQLAEVTSTRRKICSNSGSKIFSLSWSIQKNFQQNHIYPQTNFPEKLCKNCTYVLLTNVQYRNLALVNDFKDFTLFPIKNFATVSGMTLEVCEILVPHFAGFQK